MNIIDIRKKKLESIFDCRKAKILEIGALDSPTFRRPGFNVKYLDYASKIVLAEKGVSNQRYRAEKLVEVDFISSTPEYTKVISEKFDCILANHVIEHIPDIIRWLNELKRLLNDNGVLFLSVPDKRYTFDIARRETNFIDLLRNYNEKLKKPNFYHLLDHFFYHKKIKKEDVWNNNYKDKLKVMRFAPMQAIEVAEKNSALEYADVHCHVFTKDSFELIIKTLSDLGLIHFRSVQIDDILQFGNEFHVIFRK